MRLTFAAISTVLVVASKPYQRDAPIGRWINGEHPPSSRRSSPDDDSQVACPTSFGFCIDTRWSDPKTCLYPSPHLIKRCYDEGCIHSGFGQQRALEKLEDTYCKDFMDVEGRFCQWTEQVRCTCPAEIEDIVYANAIVVQAGGEVPEGYAVASECIYPSNNIKRMRNGAYIDVPVPGGAIPPPVPNDPKLKGDLNWVDPDSDNAPTVTLRPAPVLNAEGGETSTTTKSSDFFAGLSSFMVLAATSVAILL